MGVPPSPCQLILDGVVPIHKNNNNNKNAAGALQAHFILKVVHGADRRRFSREQVVQQREPGLGPGFGAQTSWGGRISERGKGLRGRVGADKGVWPQGGRQRLCRWRKPARAIHPDSFYLSSCPAHRELCPHWDADRPQWTRGHRPDHVLHQFICEPHKLPRPFQVPNNQLGSFQIGPRNGHLAGCPEHSSGRAVRPGSFRRSAHALAWQRSGRASEWAREDQTPRAFTLCPKGTKFFPNPLCPFFSLPPP